VVEMGLMLRAIRKGPQPEHGLPAPAPGGVAHPVAAE